MSSAPKESRFGKELQAHMEGVVAQHFAAQRLRLRQGWEPRVVGEAARWVAGEGSGAFARWRFLRIVLAGT